MRQSVTRASRLALLPLGLGGFFAGSFLVFGSLDNVFGSRNG